MNLVIFESEKSEWVFDKQLTLEEKGFLIEIFTYRLSRLEPSDFNCSLYRYDKIIKNLNKYDYLHVYDGFSVIFDRKTKILTPFMIDFIKKLGYNLTKRRDKVKKTIDYEEDFKSFFSIYPKRTGLNSKVEAYTQWKQRKIEGHTADEMIKAATNYQAFCNKTGTIGTEFVYAAKNFIGKNKIFLEQINIIRNENNDKKNSSNTSGGRFSAAKLFKQKYR